IVQIPTLTDCYRATALAGGWAEHRTVATAGITVGRRPLLDRLADRLARRAEDIAARPAIEVACRNRGIGLAVLAHVLPGIDTDHAGERVELGIVSVARRRPHGLKIPALGGRERHEAGCVLERLGREARRLEGARSTATPPRACLV